jgi:hydroxyethylthiazole kinase-like uncharacterized protein yjeF
MAIAEQQAIYTVAEIRTLESRAFAAQPEPPLMARAGRAAAEHAQTLLAQGGKRVLVVAGPGNNGGDALEVAAHLKRGFHRVSVVFVGDPAKLSGDATAALQKWRAVDGQLLVDVPHRERFDLAIDGLFGIGLARPLEGRIAALIDTLNALTCPVLAIDIPSGLDADTGAVRGCAVRATHTITFIALKPGLLTLDGPDHCGDITVDAIGLDVEQLLPAQGRTLDRAILDRLPRARPRNFHKGQAGSLAIIGGASGMVGAALLAGRAALKTGAGKVFVGMLDEQAPAVDWLQPELMLRPPEGLLNDGGMDAFAIGPGLGQDANAQRLLALALRSDKPLVVDADGLNLIAAYSVLQNAATARKASTVLTPHPAEAARLLGTDTSAVLADRVQCALELARKFTAHVVLKGNGSVVASPDGHWWINTSGNPGMASGGMGDTLTGIAGSLLAQRVPARDALLAAVWLHGAAADALLARGAGPLGLAAGDLIEPAREILNASVDLRSR